jgi:hypothetical protein
MSVHNRSWASFSAAVIGAIAIGSGEVSAQAIVVFDNIATTGGLDVAGASPASQVDSVFPFNAGAADDFVVPASPLCRWSIGSVRWACKHWGNASPNQVSAFRIVFWSDEEGLPQSGLNHLPDLGLAFASFTVPVAGGIPNAAAPDAFDFEAVLPQSVEFMPGKRYWIEIQAVAQYPPQWGMHITQGRQGLGPIQYFDLLSIPAWMSVPDDGDLAFQLLGNATTGNCNDGNACTVDSCVNGECVSSMLSCNDGDSCTADSCDSQQGCVHTAMNCADADPCTTDICLDGACAHFGPPDFDGDGDVDLLDYAVVASCSIESSPGSEPACQCADLNSDGRIDLKDMALMQRMRSNSK